MGGQPGGDTGAPGTGGTMGDVPCHEITDEVACLQRQTVCRADYCVDFVRCATPEDPRLACAVPPGSSCSMFERGPTGTPPIGCMLAPWCHPIYTAIPPPEVCASPIDCTMLVSCGDNGTANCSGATGTHCGGDPPSCAPGYVPSLNGAGCYEGCVPVSYCAS